MRKACALLIGLLLVAASQQAMAEEIQAHAQNNLQMENDVADLINSIPEDKRAQYGVQPFGAYLDDKTGLTFVRADDKMFLKHDNKGKFFIKTEFFWAPKVSKDSVIALSEKCLFPPTVPLKNPGCPNGAVTCPAKEEAHCDKQLSQMNKFVQNGLLTKEKFECLDRFLKPSKPSLSYICVFNGVRPALEGPPAAPMPAPQPQVQAPPVYIQPQPQPAPFFVQPPAPQYVAQPRSPQAASAPRRTTTRRGGLGL